MSCTTVPHCHVMYQSPSLSLCILSCTRVSHCPVLNYSPSQSYPVLLSLTVIPLLQSLTVLSCNTVLFVLSCTLSLTVLSCTTITQYPFLSYRHPLSCPVLQSITALYCITDTQCPVSQSVSQSLSCLLLQPLNIRSCSAVLTVLSSTTGHYCYVL